MCSQTICMFKGIDYEFGLFGIKDSIRFKSSIMDPSSHEYLTLAVL